MAESFLSNVNVTNVSSYIVTTPVYGNIMMWHLILFMLIGPMLTWPMLVLILIVFGKQAVSTVKDVKSVIVNNG